MSGTKFRVKKSETHTDSNGVEYEIGAEINQDFPIEAPNGSTGKLLVNHDLEVNGEIISDDDLVTVNPNLTVTGTTTSSTITDGTLSINSGNITAAGSISAATITATTKVATPKVENLGTLESASETLIIKRDNDSDIGVRIESTSNNSSYIDLVEDTGGDTLYGLRIIHSDGDYPETVNNYWCLQSKAGSYYSNILSNHNQDSNTVLQANNNLYLGVNSDNSSGSGGYLRVYKDVSITPNVDNLAEGTLLFEVSDSGIGTFPLGHVESSKYRSTSITTDLEIGQTGQDKINVLTDELLINGNVSLRASTNNLVVAPPKITETVNGVETLVEDYSGDPCGITVIKEAQGSAFLEAGEYETVQIPFIGTFSGTSGVRLAYEGDSTNEDLGTIGDYIALQAMQAGAPTNVLTFNNLGQSLKLESQTGMTLETNNAGDFIVETNDDTVEIRASTIKLRRVANGDCTYIFYDMPEDTDGDNSYMLGITANGYVKKATNNLYFFSGTHVYKSEVALPIGSSVELINGALVVSTTKNSKVCVGIVSANKEYSEENPIETSFGEKPTSGFAVYVVSIGDTRHRKCTGFNICNENGDIEAGDLLVTSSTPGYLMKQDDDIIRSCTVGKAMENVVFNEQGQANGVYGYLYCG